MNLGDGFARLGLGMRQCSAALGRQREAVEATASKLRALLIRPNVQQLELPPELSKVLDRTASYKRSLTGRWDSAHALAGAAMKKAPKLRKVHWLACLALVWIGSTLPLIADEPKTTTNPDGTTTTTTQVDYGKRDSEEWGPEREEADRPFYGKGEKRTTRDKDGNVTKIEWVKKGIVRRAVFFGKEPERDVVTRYDYDRNGKIIHKEELAYSKSDGKLVSKDEEKYKPDGQVDTSLGKERFRDGKYDWWNPETEEWEEESGVENESDSTLEDTQRRYHALPKPPPEEKSPTPKPETGPASLSSLLSQDQVNLDILGAGETIGHVAMLRIENLTDRPLTCSVPAMILESRSGKSQHYACPEGQTITLKPRQKFKVPVNGVCLNRNKPPAGKGTTGDLVMNEGKPNVARNSGLAFPGKKSPPFIAFVQGQVSRCRKTAERGGTERVPLQRQEKAERDSDSMEHLV